MRLEEMYARALFASHASEPKKVLEHLEQALKRRGHEKLKPRILSEYRKLAAHGKRMEMHTSATPERERTRQLLELYRKLVASN